MRIAFSLFLCMSHYVVVCQERQLNYIEIKGVLFDSLTRQPIPAAHILTRHFKIASNPDGSFSILVLPSDTLRISHIGYHTILIPVNRLKDHSQVKVAMKQEITLLESVEVQSILTEEKFKLKILETTPVESLEERNANANMAVLNYYIKSLPQLPMTAGENYHEYLKGPQGVIFFSSSGQKGLIKAIRNVIKTKPIEYKASPNQNGPAQNLNIPTLKDSLLRKNKTKADSLNSQKSNNR